MFLGFLLMLLGAAIVIVPFWKILQRLGYSPYLSLLTVLPFVNVGLLYFIAFTDWPMERDAAPPEET